MKQWVAFPSPNPSDWLATAEEALGFVHWARYPGGLSPPPILWSAADDVLGRSGTWSSGFVQAGFGPGLLRWVRVRSWWRDGVGRWMSEQGGFDAEQARGERGQPPVPTSEQCYERGHEQRAYDGGVEQDACSQTGGEDLDVGLGGRAQRDEGQEQD